MVGENGRLIMKNKTLLEDVTSLRTSLERTSQERDSLTSQLKSLEDEKEQLGQNLTEVSSYPTGSWNRIG